MIGNEGKEKEPVGEKGAVLQEDDTLSLNADPEALDAAREAARRKGALQDELQVAPEEVEEPCSSLIARGDGVVDQGGKCDQHLADQAGEVCVGVPVARGEERTGSIARLSSLSDTLTIIGTGGTGLPGLTRWVKAKKKEACMIAHAGLFRYGSGSTQVETDVFTPASGP